MPRKMSKESKLRKYKYEAQYAIDNTTQVKLKLNNKTDADILAYLSAVTNKQGLIKQLLRSQMEDEGFVFTPEDQDQETPDE